MDRMILQYGGLTWEQMEKYHQLEEKYGRLVYPMAADFVSGAYDHIGQLYDPLREIAPEESELVGAMLLLVMESARLRAQSLEGHKKQVFLESLIDISCKIRECQAYKKAFGIFVMNWYHGLIKNWRPTLGRLQYEVGIHDGPDIRVGSFVLRKGDKKLQCHIPSLGPLTRENCMASLKKAWAEFPEYRKDGVLPVLCHSWLFYPPYEAVFGPDTGVGMFRTLWHYYQVTDHSIFYDCWRVFSMDLPEDLSQLPRDTRMQRAFADYIEKGGSFGDGCGILLFDGNTIVKTI